MPTDRSGWWWDKKKLQAALDTAGSWAALARSTSVPINTLKHAGGELNVKPPAKAKSGTITIVQESADEALQHELKEAQKKLRKAEAGGFDVELMARRIEAAVKDNAPEFKPIEFEPVTAGDRTAQEMVLLFSDTHASEVVRPERVENLNEYNWQEMLSRMNQITKGIVSHAGHFGFRVGRLVIPMLGDMQSGEVHEELARTNDRPMAEAVVDFAYDTAAWLDDLTRQMVEADVVTPDFQVVIEAVPGNHPRLSQKPSFKQYFNNGDWLYYQMLKALFAEHPAIQVNAPTSAYSTITIAERWRALLMHGDGIRTTMPGVPWGGVTRRIATLEAQMHKARKPLDFVFMGHWHSPQSLAGIHARTWINGSVKGIDEYSLAKFGSGHDAEQTLLTFHPKRGWTGTYALTLQGAQPAGEGW